MAEERRFQFCRSLFIFFLLFFYAAYFILLSYKFELVVLAFSIVPFWLSTTLVINLVFLSGIFKKGKLVKGSPERKEAFLPDIKMKEVQSGKDYSAFKYRLFGLEFLYFNVKGRLARSFSRAWWLNLLVYGSFIAYLNLRYFFLIPVTFIIILVSLYYSKDLLMLAFSVKEKP